MLRPHNILLSLVRLALGNVAMGFLRFYRASWVTDSFATARHRRSLSTALAPLPLKSSRGSDITTLYGICLFAPHTVYVLPPS